MGQRKHIRPGGGFGALGPPFPRFPPRSSRICSPQKKEPPPSACPAVRFLVFSLYGLGVAFGGTATFVSCGVMLNAYKLFALASFPQSPTPRNRVTRAPSPFASLSRTTFLYGSRSQNAAPAAAKWYRGRIIIASSAIDGLPLLPPPPSAGGRGTALPRSTSAGQSYVSSRSALLQPLSVLASSGE